MSVPLTPAFRRIACQSRLFATLPPDLRAPLLDAARVTHYDRGAPIFHQGDTALSLHIVAEGWVKLYRIAPSGAEAVVGTMTRGQSFGEPIALRQAAYPVSAEASTEARVTRWIRLSMVGVRSRRDRQYASSRARVGGVAPTYGRLDWRA